MVYTFFELQRQVLRALDEEDNATTTALVKDLINQAHQARLRSARWPFLLSPEYSLTVAADTPAIALHADAGPLVYVREPATGVVLEEVPMRQVDVELGMVEATTATKFSLWGTSPVKTQPASASVVRVVSSSSADTGATFNIAVKGEDSEGNVLIDVITPTGLTVAVGARAFTRILAITRSAQTTGTLTFTYTGGVEALVLQPWEMGKAYPLLALYPTPSVATTLAYRFYRQPLVLVNDYDIPDLPGAHAQVLVWDVLLLLAGYVGDIPPAALVEWRRMQQLGETALWNAYMDGQTLNTQTKRVRRVRGWD